MASSSASSSSCSDDHLDIAERISRARLALSSLPEELCPPSRPTSPQASSRAEDLKQAIMDAVTMANSNPTHPKWGHLTRMVRLQCTRRGYIGAGEGVRIGDVRKADIPSIKWELPETEEDWDRYVRRWGRKFNSRRRESKYFQPEAEEDVAHAPARKAEIIREKVTTWQANVVPMEGLVPPQDDITVSAQGKSSVSTTAVNKGNGRGTDSQGLLSQSSLGFAVVKRPTVATKKQGKGNDQDSFIPVDVPNPPKSPSDVRMSSSLPQSVAPAPVADVHHPAASSSESRAVIAEVPEMASTSYFTLRSIADISISSRSFRRPFRRSSGPLLLQ
ncbi:hypothetical protein DAEQUDRAFT_289851 [Daedalea quercina L-15889]|uniref:Uncharacterized protein n=1 Tax=Daedalea quercina L-15889 TaxID=1314783 RepID=A0A165TXL6_9APHY|nr:hypothetical protein DAEQUDRAFT_289851 [Daedalea quercina L-15889]